MRLGVALGLAAALAAGSVALWPRPSAPNARVRAELAGQSFTYPRHFARDDATADGGGVDRLNFRVAAADLGVVSPKGAASTITLALTPMDDGPDPAGRAATLYARFLTPAAVEGPGGLVRRQFEPGSPYDLEELYLAPPDGRRFFARCPRPPISAPDSDCLSLFRHGAVDVELRYTPGLLDRWEEVLAGARQFIARMTARPAGAF